MLESMETGYQKKVRKMKSFYTAVKVWISILVILYFVACVYSKKLEIKDKKLDLKMKELLIEEHKIDGELKCQ